MLDDDYFTNKARREVVKARSVQQNQINSSSYFFIAPQFSNKLISRAISWPVAEECSMLCSVFHSSGYWYQSPVGGVGQLCQNQRNAHALWLSCAFEVSDAKFSPRGGGGGRTFKYAHFSQAHFSSNDLLCVAHLNCKEQI